MSLYVGTEKVAPIIRIFEEGGEPVNINNQAKTVTPTKSEQTIKHDDGYTGLGTVTVNPIPDDYIIPTGNISITENGTAINVHDYDNATVNVTSGYFDVVGGVFMNTHASAPTHVRGGGVLYHKNTVIPVTTAPYVAVQYN